MDNIKRIFVGALFAVSALTFSAKAQERRFKSDNQRILEFGLNYELTKILEKDTAIKNQDYLVDQSVFNLYAKQGEKNKEILEYLRQDELVWDMFLSATKSGVILNVVPFDNSEVARVYQDENPTIDINKNYPSGYCASALAHELFHLSRGLELKYSYDPKHSVVRYVNQSIFEEVAVRIEQADYLVRLAEKGIKEPLFETLEHDGFGSFLAKYASVYLENNGDKIDEKITESWKSATKYSYADALLSDKDWVYAVEQKHYLQFLQSYNVFYDNAIPVEIHYFDLLQLSGEKEKTNAYESYMYYVARNFVDGKYSQIEASPVVGLPPSKLGF